MSNLNLVFSAVFVVALVAMVGTKLWLASRQIRHVAANRNDVPQQFTGTIPLAAHQRAADYTVERTRLTMIEVVVSAAVLIALTLLGGVQQLDLAISDWLGRGYAGQIALVAAVVAITSLIDLPFDYARHFVIEEKFGFNRMSKKLFFVDLVKGVLLGIAVGLPLLFVTLWLMDRAGPLWWLWTWMVWVAFQLLSDKFTLSELRAAYAAILDPSQRRSVMLVIGWLLVVIFVPVFMHIVRPNNPQVAIRHVGQAERL